MDLSRSPVNLWNSGRGGRGDENARLGVAASLTPCDLAAAKAAIEPQYDETSSPSTNNIVVAFVLGFWADNTGMSVTDNQGNTYTERDSRVDGTGFYCKVFTCPINTATAGTFGLRIQNAGGSALNIEVEVEASGVFVMS